MGILNSLLDYWYKKPVQKEPFENDKAKWQYQSCLEEYCKVNNKTASEVTKKDGEYIQECSGLLISYFLTWLINNDFIKSDVDKKALDEVKNRKLATTKLFGREFDYVLDRNDISDDVIGFVDDYYHSGFYRDYPEYMEKRGKNIFCCEFSWEDYDNLEKIVDKAYSDYNKRRRR